MVGTFQVNMRRERRSRRRGSSDSNIGQIILRTDQKWCRGIISFFKQNINNSHREFVFSTKNSYKNFTFIRFYVR